MLELLHAAWRGRRVLLAGGEDEWTQALASFLRALGARPSCIAPDADNETIARALTQGRTACLIAACARQRQLDTLLYEAREAGVPLALLLHNAAALSAIPWDGDIRVLRDAGEDAAQALTLGARALLGDI